MSMRQTCLIPTLKADLQIPNLMQAAINLDLLCVKCGELFCPQLTFIINVGLYLSEITL